MCAPGAPNAWLRCWRTRAAVGAAAAPAAPRPPEPEPEPEDPSTAEMRAKLQVRESVGRSVSQAGRQPGRRPARPSRCAYPMAGPFGRARVCLSALLCSARVLARSFLGLPVRRPASASLRPRFQPFGAALLALQVPGGVAWACVACSDRMRLSVNSMEAPAWIVRRPCASSWCASQSASGRTCGRPSCSRSRTGEFGV
jgi:hypothetical protein